MNRSREGADAPVPEESAERKPLALALLYAMAHRYLSGADEVPLYAVVAAIEEARRFGSTPQEIRHTLEKADAATTGRQAPESAVRLKRLYTS